MGFGTVFATIAFMFIFAGMIVFALTVQKNLTLHASEQRVAADRERVQSNSNLIITGASYAVGAVVSWTDTTYADFNAGSMENTTTISPGTVVLQGPSYEESGTWTSTIIDTGASATNYTTISWTAVLPLGTSLSFQARAGASVAALESSSFTGPDGTPGSSYVSSGTTLNETVHSETRYLQYQATLSTTDDTLTPQLQAVSIGIQRPGGSASITVRNSGSEKLPHSETDLYLVGERVPRTTSSRTIDLSSASDQLLWLPGESVTYTVFRTIATPAQITVANGAAQAAGVVS